MDNKECKTCQRWYKGRCLALNKQQDNCWAWTDDEFWKEDYKVALKKYRDVKKLGSYYFNREKPKEFRDL